MILKQFDRVNNIMSTIQTERRGTMKNKITKNKITNLFWFDNQTLSYYLHFLLIYPIEIATLCTTYSHAKQNIL